MLLSVIRHRKHVTRWRVGPQHRMQHLCEGRSGEKRAEESTRTAWLSSEQRRGNSDPQLDIQGPERPAQPGRVDQGHL